MAKYRDQHCFLRFTNVLACESGFAFYSPIIGKQKLPNLEIFQRFEKKPVFRAKDNFFCESALSKLIHLEIFDPLTCI